MLDGHFKLNDSFNSLFYAGLHRSIILRVLCMFYNVNKANIRYSGPDVHLKLEGWRWFRSLGLDNIFARLEA